MPDHPAFFYRILIVALMAIPLAAGAQPAAEATGDSASARFIPRYERVMIVPLDMSFYLSDADNEIARYNRKSLAQVQAAFRYGIDLNVERRIYERYDTRRILTDTARTAQEDQRKLRAAISLHYARPKAAMEQQDPALPPAPAIKNWWRKNLGGKGENGIEEQGGDAYFEEGKVVPPSADRRFMRAELREPAVLEEMYERYGTDLFVFINQFEINTDFEHCLDRATNNFVRELSIHYSIFDREGRELGGDVITVMAASGNNDLEAIIKGTLGNLAIPVAEALPAPRYVRNRGLEPDAGMEPDEGLE